MLYSIVMADYTFFEIPPDYELELCVFVRLWWEIFDFQVIFPFYLDSVKGSAKLIIKYKVYEKFLKRMLTDKYARENGICGIQSLIMLL